MPAIRRAVLATAFAIPFAAPAHAGPQEEIEAALHDWAEAYAARDGARSAALYAPDARLWGTASRQQTAGQAGIAQYFVVTGRGLRSRSAEFGDHATRILGDVAVSSGRYDFHRIREDGAPFDTSARFSMVFLRQPDGRWLIVDHHSSPLPPTH